MKLRKIMLLAAVLLLLTGTALAESELAATIDNGVLSIRWNAVGSCVLTVYRNDWPISVCTVDGASGGTDICVDSAAGRYSVRLRTSEGCEKVYATCTTTTKPTTEPNVEPTAAPTVVPTVKPTAEPTAVPTVKPTAVPTAKPTTAPSDGQSMTSLAAEVISQVNAERAKAGLSSLSVSAELTGAACIRAREIVEQFSHTRPDGSSWSTVSAAANGENIAKGQSTADRVMAAWMSSEGHRANILRESFSTIGICALKVDGVIYWVQLFGR